MPIPLTGVVGPQILQDGAAPPLRQEKSGGVVVTELHGKYLEQNYRGNLFWATMSAGVIFPAPAATANNPMTLANPAGSGKNLNLIAFDMVMTVLPGTPLTGLYGLYVNNNPVAAAVTGTTIPILSGLVGGGNVGVAKPLSTSTVPAAPTLLKVFGQKITGSLAAAVGMSDLPAFHIDFDGSVVLTPGTAITPQQTVADTTNATVICSFAWCENAI